jgi:hypothetical protein
MTPRQLPRLPDRPERLNARQLTPDPAGIVDFIKFE